MSQKEYNQAVKLIIKIFLSLILLFIIGIVFLFGYLGFIPGLSAVLGTNKPRNLGIKYTQADLQSIRAKSRLEYIKLPDNPSPALTRQFSGQRAVSADFSSAEITATINNQPWKHWPYKNLQVKFNADGSGEISGVLLKNKVTGYAAAIGIPQEAADFAMKFLPNNPVFYVKGKAALTENKVSVFEPQVFEIGRMPMPLNLFLAFSENSLIQKVYAQDVTEMSEELAKVENKKALIIGFINDRLSTAFGSFYAKKAYFTDNKLIFDGTLTETISYTP